MNPSVPEGYVVMQVDRVFFDTYARDARQLNGDMSDMDVLKLLSRHIKKQPKEGARFQYTCGGYWDERQRLLLFHEVDIPKIPDQIRQHLKPLPGIRMGSNVSCAQHMRNANYQTTVFFLLPENIPNSNGQTTIRYPDDTLKQIQRGGKGAKKQPKATAKHMKPSKTKLVKPRRK